MNDSEFHPDSFLRDDESEDEMFFLEPRLVVHIDEGAIEAALLLYKEFLPPGGRLFDLMSSWRSHLPDDVEFEEVVGLGMNVTEMEENQQLDRIVIHNLNREPNLPFDDDEFDGAVCTVSVQYMVQPVAIFAEVGRILKPGSPFIVTFSNRCFPTKAVLLWRATDDAQHAAIVHEYFSRSASFDEVQFLDRSPSGGDPLYAVVGRSRP